MRGVGLSKIIVWPDKFRPGWDRGSDPPITSDGNAPERFPVVDALTALRRRYTTDAHFVAYRVDGLDAIPRINAGGLVELQRAGRDVVFDLIAVDLDAPNHGDGARAGAVESWSAEQLTALQVDPALWAAVGWYATRGGLRLLWLLEPATPREIYLATLRTLRQRLAALGVCGVDPLVDWQRCYRLPFVQRDGVAQQRPADLARLGRLPDTTTEAGADPPDPLAPMDDVSIGGRFELPDVIPMGSIDRTLTSYAGTMRREGAPETMIVDALAYAYERRAEKPADGRPGHTLRDFERIARSVGRYEADPVAAERAGLEVVVIRPGGLPYLFDRAGELIAEAPDVYDRSGELVAVVRSAQPQQGTAEQPRIHPLGDQAIRGLLGRAAAWVRIRKSKDGDPVEAPADVPLDVARELRQRGGWSGVRTLQGVTETPTLRPDGSVLDVPGYDAATGVVFAPAAGFVWPPVAERPSLDDARRAVATLRELLTDFPFQEPEHAAVVLAAILTAIARPGIDGPAPLFLLDATTPGSGKGLLAHVIATLATGRGAAVMVQTGPEETEKRVTALLLSSTPVILIDNVDRPLGGAAIDAALTADIWQGRRLGQSSMCSVRNRSTWLATGNNIHVRGDLVRRCLRCYLAPNVERPELLDGFRYPDLVGHVSGTRRGMYTAAALTIIRAYVSAGRPDLELPAFGGFGAWSSMIRAPLVWAGVPDPVATQHALRQHADLTVEAQGGIVNALGDVFGDSDTTVRAMIDRMALSHSAALTGNADAEDAVDRLRESCIELAGDKRGEINARRLGWALRRLLGRIFGGRRLVRGTPDRTGATWRVETVEPSRAREADTVRGN